MATTHVTYCRNCPAVCGLLIDTEDNRITKIVGDKEHPLSQGYFCIKGMSSMDLHNGDNRLFNSRARQSDGGQRDIDVEQAMDEIVARLKAIIAEHGPGAVAMYYGTGINYNSLGHSAMKGWLHQIGSPYIFSSMTIDQSAKWVAIGRMGFFVTGKYSALDADVLMEVGENVAVSHQSSNIPMTAPMLWLRAARRRGMKLIVVDPRRTETARQADFHLPVKPGEDAALFAGMIRLVLERGWEDLAFCDRFVSGLEELRAAVQPFTLDLVAARTGVDAAVIEQATEAFATARRKSTGTGTGPNMSAFSNTNEHLIEALNAICGGYRRAGDVVRNTGALFGRGVTRETVYPPYRPWENGTKLKTVDLGPAFGEYPTALLPREIEGKGNEKIRALIVVGGNPLKAIPDPDRTLQAFEDLDLLVTLDPRPTDSTARADYVIATSLPYERHDYTGVFDGYFVKTFAHVATPLLQRPQGVIDDWEFFWGLAKRAGKPLEIKTPGFGSAHPDIPGPTLTLPLDQKPAAEELIRWMVSQGPLDHDRLLPAASGLVNEEVRNIEPAEEDDGARLQLCPADVAEEIAAVAAAPLEDPAYPFRLVVRRLIETVNSAYVNAAATRRRYPTNPVFIHPDDMSDLGMTAGDRCSVRSDNGEVVAVARPDPMVRRGVVSLPHGWGTVDPADDPEHRTGANAARLISLERHVETINHMPRMSGIPVAIQRL